MIDEAAIAELKKPLDPRHVASRQQGGGQVSYIEAWHAINEANRIFGFGGWTRETIELTQLGEPYEVNGKVRVNYRAKVRVTVGTDALREIVREGCGFGQGIDKDVGQAHESALKEAETDAMKRALMTFGNPFGLALYDKSQANVGTPEPEKISPDDVTRIEILLEGNRVPVAELLAAAKVDKVTDIRAERVPAVMRWIEKRIAPAKEKEPA